MTVDIPVEIFQRLAKRVEPKVENVEIIDDGGTVRILESTGEDVRLSACTRRVLR